MASLPAARSASGFLIVWGAILWAIGVALLRAAAALGWLEGPGLIAVYALLALVTWPLLPLTLRLARLPASEMVPASALVSGTAVTIDGIVIGFAPWIYASDPVAAKAAAGSLLWAIGMALLLAFVRAPRH